MSNCNWHRQRIDPIAFLKEIGVTTDHITYDPAMRKGDYNIIRQSSHDGTVLFTSELLYKTLEPIVNQVSFCKSRQAAFYAATNVRYVIGPVRLSTVYGRVNLPAGDFPGERQRTRMPVKVIEIS